MQKPNLTKMCRSVKTATVKHSPEILTGVGIAGMVTTTVMAVRATPKAIQLLDEEKRRQHTDVDYRITCNNGNQRTLIKP